MRVRLCCAVHVCMAGVGGLFLAAVLAAQVLIGMPRASNLQQQFCTGGGRCLMVVTWLPCSCFLLQFDLSHMTSCHAVLNASSMSAGGHKVWELLLAFYVDQV